MGIPEEELGKITDAFYMVDKSRSRKEGGSGLGLALCVKVAEIHGGCLKIESQTERGDHGKSHLLIYNLFTS